MYIYSHKFSRPARRYSPQLNGFSGDASKPAAAKLRVGTYWANDFTKACTHNTRLSQSDDLARGFARAMVAKGHQWAVDHDSFHASPTDWLSFPDKKGIPFDNSDVVQGVDTTDFAYLVTHGAVTFVDKPGNPLFVYRAAFGKDATLAPAVAFKTESTSTGSWPKCIWLNNKSRLGDKRLRWLVVDSCESLQMPGFVKSEKMNLDVDPEKLWSHAFHGLNMILGFTGYSSDAWWSNSRGSAFGRRAGSGDKLASAWVDEAYSYWVKDTPAAMACGHNEADAAHRLRFDRVTAPFVKIPHDKIGWYSWIWRS